MDSKPMPPLWMDEQREAERVRAARLGDVEAYRELVRHYERPVYRLAFALTRRHEDAADLATDTFLRGQAEIARLAEGKRFLPWLLRFARNLSVTLARRRAEAAAGEGPRRQAPDTPKDQVELEQRILDGLRELRPDEQMALALRICEQLPYSDITTLLDHGPGVTLSRLSAARALLLSRSRDGIGGLS